MKRLWAQAVKELAQFRRDKLTVALAFVLPVLSFFIFGYGVRLEQKDIPIAIQDQDNTPLSRGLTERLVNNAQMKAIGFKGDPIHGAVDPARAQAAIIIPPDFTRMFKSGSDAAFQVLIDGSDVNNARVIKNSVLATTNFFAEQLTYGYREPLLTTNIRIWFNPGREESLYVVPGAIGLILWIYPSLLASLAMVKEKEQGTILQAYASSISPLELVGGKALAYLFVGIAEWLLTMFLAWLCFGITFAGDPTPFLLGSLIFIFDSVLFGLVIGSGVATQSAAVQAVAFAGFTTALLLSGFLYPIRNIRFPFDYVSLIVPARYYLVISRDAFVRGSGWPGVWLMMLALVAFAFVYIMVARRRMGSMQIKKS